MYICMYVYMVCQEVQLDCKIDPEMAKRVSTSSDVENRLISVCFKNYTINFGK